MQVKKDISEGRLNAPMTSTILLSSFVVQSTIGDYDPDTCGSGYLTPYYNLRKHSINEQNLDNNELDRRIVELHKLHKCPGEM